MAIIFLDRLIDSQYRDSDAICSRQIELMLLEELTICTRVIVV